MPGPMQTLERELKLGAGARFRLPDLGGEPVEPRVFTSTYHDTEDHRLARAGVTLRRRVERSRGLWQLKLPRGVARLELEVPGGPAGPPRELEGLLPAYLRGGELRPVAKLRTRRGGIRVLASEGPVAEVTVDRVAILGPDRRVTGSFREIEAELTDGDERALRRIEKALRRAGAGDGDGRPKLLRALDLEQAPDPATVPPSAPAVEHLAAMLAAQYRAIVAHDPGTRLGTEPEELHQMRVATRRARAFLRAARPLLDPAWSESLRLELRWLATLLGPVRDLDVLLEQLRSDAEALDARERRALQRLFAALESERSAARAALLAALESPRYLELLDRLEEAASHPGAVESDVTLREIAAAEFRRLRKAVRALGESPEDQELHAVRLRGKRARYAAELAEPAVGKPATRFIREAKVFQDVLGSHQDAVVAEERIRSLVARSGGRVLAFAAGRLVESQRARRREARAAFPAAWKRLRVRGRRAWS